MTSRFGWGYPPGAEHDPFAPWNQVDPPDECPVCGDDIGEGYEGYCSEQCFIIRNCEVEEWEREL